MKNVIIVVGGDSGRRLRLRNNFGSDQYDIYECRSLLEFTTTIGQESIAAVLLLYPDESGIISELFECDLISSCTDNTPVIFVSSSSLENTRLRYLRYKADEFLIEPISSSNITNVIIEKLDLLHQDEPIKALTVGDLVLNRTLQTVTLRNVKLTLQPLQVRILDLLMQNPGRTFTRQEISSNIWSGDRSIEDRTIDVAIGRIRGAVKSKVTVDPIRTVRSIGYAFNEKFGQVSSLPRKGRGIRRPKRLRPVAAD